MRLSLCQKKQPFPVLIKFTLVCRTVQYFLNWPKWSWERVIFEVEFLKNSSIQRIWNKHQTNVFQNIYQKKQLSGFGHKYLLSEIKISLWNHQEFWMSPNMKLQYNRRLEQRHLKYVISKVYLLPGKYCKQPAIMLPVRNGEMCFI